MEVCDSEDLDGLFFFQAEDGIRDYKVTGVQTCALPISRAQRPGPSLPRISRAKAPRGANGSHSRIGLPIGERPRSEERRVGKEGRSRGGAEPWREKTESRAGEGRQGRTRSTRQRSTSRQ